MPTLYDTFIDPPREYTQMPFWFWNDAVTEEGITEQLESFCDAGVFGFVIHPRKGIPKTIPYLGPRYMALVRHAVREAARLGMTVHLYDEAMYPSGSAHGLVVNGRPDLAARGLAMCSMGSRQDNEDELVARVVWRIHQGTYQGHLLPSSTYSETDFRVYQAHGWTISDLICRPTGGTIRGVHPDEDDGEPCAPKASDLLNMEATLRFIEFTHEAYFKELSGYFGNTVTAIFTDEPSLLGRCSRDGLKPWTAGIAEDLSQQLGYDCKPYLPLLWVDAGQISIEFRSSYEHLIYGKLHNNYYKPLSKWCMDHQIALTGHTAESDELTPLKLFQLPGQDMVWRWVLPNSKESLEGPHSTVGKCTSSAKFLWGAPRNGNEIFGAYGWEFTCDEMKWLMDWLFVRGVDLLWPHAFYYTTKGWRGDERPPDVGPNNLWWPYYKLFADYSRRISWLMATRTYTPKVAILTQGRQLAWKLAKSFLTHQIDFIYLPVEFLRDFSNGIFEHIYCESDFITYVDSSENDISIENLDIKPELTFIPFDSHLRVAPAHHGTQEIYFITNEGESEINTSVVLERNTPWAEWWDPWLGEKKPANIQEINNNTLVRLRLKRRSSIILVLGRASTDSTRKTEVPGVDYPFDLCLPPISMSEWTIEKKEVGQGQVLGCLTPWERLSGYENYIGQVVYTTDVIIPVDGHYTLDLGKVENLAEVWVDNTEIGVRLWSPYIYESLFFVAGVHKLRVVITNSIAKSRVIGWSGSSGLLGPVTLISTRVEQNTR